MKEEWTGVLIGKMHNADVTQDELATELGWGKSYVSMILNGQRSPTDARSKLESAFEAIVTSRTSADK